MQSGSRYPEKKRANAKADYLVNGVPKQDKPISKNRYLEHDIIIGNDNVPEFLTSTIPILDEKSHKNLLGINKDQIDPYAPAQNARKLSSSSIKSETLSNVKQQPVLPDKSFHSEGDTFQFSFEDAKEYHNQLSPNVSNFSFHTANSSQLSITDRNNALPPTPNIPVTLTKTSSPKLQLKIETSTPNTSIINNEEDFESSNNFSFSNRSQLNRSTSIKSSTMRNSPLHTRNSSSISWKVNNPDEWTIERVVFWLELNQFNETWIKVFQKHNITGRKFLSLTNYQNFNIYKNELDTKSDSTQSRFIHLLRKTLDKPSSATTITGAFSPLSVNSSFDGVDNKRSVSETNSPSDLLAPVVSAPNMVNSSSSSSSAVNTPTTSHTSSKTAAAATITTNTRKNLNTKARKQRPVSTIESSSKNMWASSSPVSSSITFFRRHKKSSSSSESSLFSSLFSQSSSTISQSEKKLSTSSASPIKTTSSSASAAASNKSSSTSSSASTATATATSSSTSTKVDESKSVLSKLMKKSNNTSSGSSHKPISPLATTHSKKSVKIGDRKLERKPPPADNKPKKSSISSSTASTPTSASSSSFSATSTFASKSKPTYTGTTVKPKLKPSSVSSSSTSASVPGSTASPSTLTSPLPLPSPSPSPSPSTSASTTAPSKLFSLINKKYLPTSQPNDQGKFILVTNDNSNFKLVNIASCKDVDTLKKTIIESLYPNLTTANIYLTDFGCSSGEELDDGTISLFMKDNFSDLSSMKLLVLPINPGTISSIASSSITTTSSSDAISFDTKDEDKLYPNTPQHFYDDNYSKPNEVDYLNFKDKQSIIQQADVKSNPAKPQATPAITLKSPPKKPQVKKASSFRVIRPTNDKVEINFDKRRESPFANKQDLVAKRTAPRPPLRKPVSLKSIEVPSLTPVAEDHKNNNDYISTYTPGSSNTLIPEPYKGNESISPISRKELLKEFEVGHKIDKRPTISRTMSKKSIDEFNENVISFEDAPTLEDEDESSEDEGDSDEDFWAKPPSDIKTSNKNNDQDDNKSPKISKMMVRPAPEVLYDNLEKFFPNANLDQPVDVLSPPVSPLVSKATNDDSVVDDVNNNRLSQKNEDDSKVQRKVITSLDDANDNLLKPHRVKTIRAVAREAIEARKRAFTTSSTTTTSSNSTKPSQQQSNSSNKSNNNNSNHDDATNNKPVLLRRQSTKMWGRKVVEVKPNEGHGQIVGASKSRNNAKEIKQFSWIRGELIGKGTFGNVYLALNITTGEMIAVKQVIVADNIFVGNKRSEMIEALHSEVETLKDLDHLNIVQYLGFENTGKEYNLFLEYVAGGSVASCLRLYGRFDEPLIKFLTLQVLEGLAYLHSRGILHRDMKADNLLLDLDGVCKISDFGISKKSNDIYANNASMSMQGTIFWMAPEVVDSREGYSAKVDIWSLGCVVLEMFAGRRPWSSLEAITAMFKIGKAKASPPIPEDTLPFVSQIGREFLDSCFAIDANQRPTAQQLIQDPFCVIDKNFTFASTKLAALIKSKEKKIKV